MKNGSGPSGVIYFVDITLVDGSKVYVHSDESVKAVSDLISPVSGTVLEINEELLDSPELLNDDPYANWIIKVENVSDTEELLSAAAYADFCETEA